MSTTSPTVSIIVPIYNAGKRLANCLDTLVHQTLQNIEIILVLDLPTDGSDVIAKKYAAEDNRIVIVENKTNLHIGNSRNEGLKVARGEYIGFSDHDDYRTLDMYEKLYSEAISGNFDLVMGVNYYSDKRITISQFPENLKGKELKEFLLKDLLADSIDDALIPIATNVHPNLYKSTFILENDIWFYDTKKYVPEDRIFQIKCLTQTNKVTFISTPFYHHILHLQSAVHEESYQSYRLRAAGKNAVYEFLSSKNIYEKYKPFFLKSVHKEFSDNLLNFAISEKNIKSIVECINFLKTFPFSKEAFRTTNPSLKRYRIGGKISRLLVKLLMKI